VDWDKGEGGLLKKVGTTLMGKLKI